MFASKDVAEKYAQRFARYSVALRGGAPDRVPMRFFFQEVAAKYAGHTAQQVACDYNLAFDDTRNMAAGIGSDAVMLNAIWSNYGVGKSASWKYLGVPGVDIGMESVLQYSEPERESDALMRGDEYAEFAGDPTGFLYGKWFARYTTRLSAPGEPVTIGHNATLCAGALAYANYMNAFGPAAHRLKYEAGVVSANSGMVKAPLDILADKLRGYVNTAIDTVERPKEVLRACEALMPHLVANALAGADPEGVVPVTLWAHRGCTPFFSQETFDGIFWPTLKPVLEAIIAAGHQVLFYGEGNWENHYDALLSLPPGGIIYHLDKGDPALAAKILKPKFPLSGGLSYDVLARGSLDQTREHTKFILDAMARDGGYMLDCSALMLNDIRIENVKCAAETAMAYGTYSQGHAGRPMPEVAAPDPIGPSDAIGPATIPASEKRPPNTVRSFDVERAGYKKLSGDVELVKRSWQAADAAAYNYIWTTLMW